MRVIDLFGGPGSGKSTTAAGLFYEMKMLNKKVELVTEYAKDLYYSEILHIYTPTRQETIFAEQLHRVERLKGKVDWAIVDSPLPLSLIYGEPKPTSETFYQLAMESFFQFDNLNYFIDRPHMFESEGRIQNLNESLGIDRKILDVLDKYKVSFLRFEANELLVHRILSNVLGA